jgi:hypothetical protein
MFLTEPPKVASRIIWRRVALMGKKATKAEGLSCERVVMLEVYIN